MQVGNEEEKIHYQTFLLDSMAGMLRARRRLIDAVLILITFSVALIYSDNLALIAAIVAALLSAFVTVVEFRSRLSQLSTSVIMILPASYLTSVVICWKHLNEVQAGIAVAGVAVAIYALVESAGLHIDDAASRKRYGCGLVHMQSSGEERRPLWQIVRHKPVSVMLFVCALAVMFPILYISTTLLILPLSLVLPVPLLWAVLWSSIMSIILAIVIEKLWSRVVPSAEDLESWDRRPPIVLLRSFNDDDYSDQPPSGGPG